MTLIVGIRCTDGVVMAADGAATYATLGQQTIRQTTRKLEIVQGAVILGVSGPVGLAQLICDGVETLQKGGAFANKKPADVMRRLREELWKDVGVALKQASIARQLLGDRATASALSHTLVAAWLRGGPALIQVDQQCAPEAASDDLPFVSIGSGQKIADPFLAFLRRRFWHDRTPSLADGRFVACWTLEHAIETNPGGVAEPYEVAILEGTGPKDASARKLDDSELDELRQHVDAAREHLTAFREKLIAEPAPAEEPTAPPEPDS